MRPRLRPGAVGLGLHPGRARHRLHAPGNHDVGVAGADRLRGESDGAHARGAEAIDGQAGDGIRKPGEQHGHPGDVAVVLARLIGRTEDHLVDRLGRHAGTRHRAADHESGEVIGADGCQHPAVPPDRGAHTADEKRVRHRLPLPRRLWRGRHPQLRGFPTDRSVIMPRRERGPQRAGVVTPPPARAHARDRRGTAPRDGPAGHGAGDGPHGAAPRDGPAGRAATRRTGGTPSGAPEAPREAGRREQAPAQPLARCASTVERCPRQDSNLRRPR